MPVACSPYIPQFAPNHNIPFLHSALWHLSMLPSHDTDKQTHSHYYQMDTFQHSFFLAFFCWGPAAVFLANCKLVRLPIVAPAAGRGCSNQKSSSSSSSSVLVSLFTWAAPPSSSLPRSSSKSATRTDCWRFPGRGCRGLRWSCKVGPAGPGAGPEPLIALVHFRAGARGCGWGA
jgi:hypothetical protein